MIGTSDSCLGLYLAGVCLGDQLPLRTSDSKTQVASAQQGYLKCILKFADEEKHKTYLCGVIKKYIYGECLKKCITVKDMLP